jgi:hypothetical protein
VLLLTQNTLSSSFHKKPCAPPYSKNLVLLQIVAKVPQSKQLEITMALIRKFIGRKPPRQGRATADVALRYSSDVVNFLPADVALRYSSDVVNFLPADVALMWRSFYSSEFVISVEIEQ